MNKYVKEFGKVLLVCGALVFLVAVPTVLSVLFCYLCGYVSKEIVVASMFSSMIGFFWYIWVMKTLKIKMDSENENAENTE